MHEGALTDRGKELFPFLSRFQDFYLVGGTALALQIGHRKSVDFDMFITGGLPDRLLQTVKRVFSNSSIVVTYNVPGQLNLLIDNIKATFFHYEYPVIDPFVFMDDVPLVSIREIAAMKAFAIGKRLSFKDYVDWYFLLSEGHVLLQDVITLAEQKYGGDFNDRLFLGQLVSFDDIREAPIDFLRDPVDRKHIQETLEEHVRSFRL